MPLKRRQSDSQLLFLEPGCERLLLRPLWAAGTRRLHLGTSFLVAGGEAGELLARAPPFCGCSLLVGGGATHGVGAQAFNRLCATIKIALLHFDALAAG